jgi:hypothetical protein
MPGLLEPGAPVKERLIRRFDELYPSATNPISMHNDLKATFAQQHEMIEQLKDEKHVEQAQMLGLSVRIRSTKEVLDPLDVEILHFKHCDPEAKETEKVFSEEDARIGKFHNELLQKVIELYAIPPERLRKTIQDNDLKDTAAKKLTGVKHTHTLYKALFKSLKYIHDKYYKD